jgi:hypothetical protein
MSEQDGTEDTKAQREKLVKQIRAILHSRSLKKPQKKVGFVLSTPPAGERKQPEFLHNLESRMTQWLRGLNHAIVGKQLRRSLKGSGTEPGEVPGSLPERRGQSPSGATAKNPSGPDQQRVANQEVHDEQPDTAGSQESLNKQRGSATATVAVASAAPVAAFSHKDVNPPWSRTPPCAGDLLKI